MADTSNSLRIDPKTGLPLPDPFPEYVVCPNCGELEVEVYCYQETAHCRSCGHEFMHQRPTGCGTFPFCKRGQEGH
jgi:transcription elongation factor Elf1